MVEPEALAGANPMPKVKTQMILLMALIAIVLFDLWKIEISSSSVHPHGPPPNFGNHNFQPTGKGGGANSPQNNVAKCRAECIFLSLPVLVLLLVLLVLFSVL
jgi:hypothetical protein